MPEPVQRWLRRVALAVLLAVAFAWVPWQVYKSDGFVRHRRMAGESEELRAGNERMRLENRAIRREIHRLRHDIDAVGAVARDELGLVGDGELIFRIDLDAAAPGRTEQAE